MIAPGTRVGKYEVRRLLGQGGFGMVFVGHDTALDRECALKFLLSEHTSRPEILQRFLKEARSAAKIKHGGIVTVFECGVVEGAGAGLDGMAYIAMELLEGQSLAQRLEAGPLPLEHVVEIARQVASALAAAHTAGIVHRDLKPDNIFLVPDPATTLGERVKVLDFGIAKLADDSGGTAHKTSTHMIFGTPRYMSPEQCKSTAKVDERSDIYALGCIAFEMACGRAPFEGDAGELIGLHQFRDAPVPRSLRADLPAALDGAITAMLAKSPADRPQTMTEVVSRLGARSSAITPAPMRAVSEVAPTLPPTVAPTVTPAAIQPTPAPAVRDAAPVSSSTTSSPPVVAAAPTVPAPRSRMRLALLGGGVAVAAAVIAVVATRSPSRPAPADAPVAATGAADTGPEASVVAAADLPEASVPPETIDASIATVPGDALAADAALAARDCEPLVRARRWTDLATCAAALPDAAAARKYQQRAKLETDADAAARAVTDAIAAGNLEVAAEKLAGIPATAAARRDAKSAYDRAEQKAVASLVAALDALDRSSDCTAYEDRLRQAEASTGKSVAAAARARVACPKKVVSVSVSSERIAIFDKVRFTTNGSRILPVSFPVLDAVAETLKSHTELRVEIQGHTDATGNDDANKRLSQQRADAVRAYLVGHGIDGGRLTAIGYGEAMPIADNRTAAGRAQNSRVELVVK